MARSITVLCLRPTPSGKPSIAPAVPPPATTETAGSTPAPPPQTAAAVTLGRLARQYAVTQQEILDMLLLNADEAVTNGLTGT
jgi:hypothetical protein